MPILELPFELQRGRLLLELPQLNKGLSFSKEERINKGLVGLLPFGEESIELQKQRAYRAFSQKESALEKHIYLRQLQNVNEVLFYSLVIEHVSELLPIIYTPTVGDACKFFSEIYRKPQGLFLNYPDREDVEQAVSNIRNENIEVIVITDGEAILGIGDQGVGGMGIPIGKLSLYTTLGGINPRNALPVVLDVGTNNQALLNDDLYVGWKHERLRGQPYDEFVELAIRAMHRRWPHAVIQFEDFGPSNSQRLLQIYADQICCFNDDIQGTAAVTVGCLFAASRITGKALKDLTYVIAGAGAAGSGIGHGLIAAMMEQGLDSTAAYARIFMLNSKGLIHSSSSRVRKSQLEFSKDDSQLASWKGDFQLQNVIRQLKPDVLIGVCGQKGYFTESIVREMSSYVDRPCIFPLSNPTNRAEALPSDLLAWTDGRAIVATGSPFEPCQLDGTTYEIAQCNNAYAFPGIGLGLSAVKARKATEEMFTATAKVIGNAQRNVQVPGTSILPPLITIQSLSREIAGAVATIAIEQDLNDAEVSDSVEQLIDDKYWSPSF